MGKVVLKGFIEVSKEELDIVRKHLEMHIELTRKEDGCLVFNVEPDLSNECRFNVYEEFDSRLSFESHQKRVQFSDWGHITKNVKRLYSIEDM